MNPTETLESRRLDILRQIAAISRMRRGTVNEQYFKKRRGDGSVIQQGPYYLYSRTEKGQSFSRRIAVEDLERYQEETANRRRFKELVQRYVLVCEERADWNGDTQGKKRLRRKRQGSAR